MTPSAQSGLTAAVARLAALMAIPIALAAVPTSVFELGHSICLWKNLFALECPGCGMARAISCAFHGAFIRAWDYNQLVVIVLPLSGAIWLRQARRDLNRLRESVT